MCGISGFNFEDEKKISAMNRALSHRGPDGAATFIQGGVSLGHNRLAIIDTSEKGAQPMHYKHLTIIHNGEVYNYLELREELESLGHTFATESDTEVILASYDEWGPDCTRRLNGMWAFCIYDAKERTLFVSRDRFGVKPLYYYAESGTFIFASEIKGVLAHSELQINKKENIDKEALDLYFSLGYIPSPYSIFKTVRKLPPAHNMLFDIDKREVRRLWRYYTLPEYAPAEDKEALVAQGAELLDSATKLRMRSDVPVGSFLSGGLDSSAVTGMMMRYAKDEKPHTFSVDFSGAYSEKEYIDEAAQHFGTNHHAVVFGDSDFEGMQEEYAKHFDEPFGDYSSFPTLAVSKVATKDVTVVLSGDGGDEVFGGYRKYVLAMQMEFVRSLPRIVRRILTLLLLPFSWVPKIAMLRKALTLSFLEKEDFYAHATETLGYSGKTHKEFVHSHMQEALKLAGGNLPEAMRVYDVLAGTLPDHFLTKVDRASMAYGLEVRSPFLDYRFVEYSMAIPNKWKESIFGKTKILMREIIKDLVPARILARGKAGFTPPLDWLESEECKKGIKEGMEVVKELCPDAHTWYEKNMNPARGKTEERIRRDRFMWLYLFNLWHKRWLS